LGDEVVASNVSDIGPTKQEIKEARPHIRSPATIGSTRMTSV
jgi:hypothetical protein